MILKKGSHTSLVEARELISEAPLPRPSPNSRKIPGVRGVSILWEG